MSLRPSRALTTVALLVGLFGMHGASMVMAPDDHALMSALPRVAALASTAELGPVAGCGMGHDNCVAVLRADRSQVGFLSAIVVAAIVASAVSLRLGRAAIRGRAPPSISVARLCISRT